MNLRSTKEEMKEESVVLNAERTTKVKFKSCDNKMFEIEETVANEFQVIKLIIEDIGIQDVIPLPNILGKTLVKLIEYCEYHVEARTVIGDTSSIAEEDIQLWDNSFVDLGKDDLLELMRAADYLNIKSLLDLTFKRVADIIVGLKTPEAIQEYFWTLSYLFPNQDFALEYINK